MMFPDLERFVAAHRPCGALSETGYALRLTCVCGAAFERWVTPEAADHDLLRSGLTAFPS